LSPFDHQTDNAQILTRLQGMGVEAELVPGGRSVIGNLRLQSKRFQSLDEAIEIDHAVFATIGRDKIKCLKPRALFQLPHIGIGDCRDVTMIEARIHLAWKQHMRELDATRQWLRQIGALSRPSEQGSVLLVPVEPPDVDATMINRERAILPSAGPLSGVPLQRLEDRAPAVDRTTRSALDLQMTLSTRMEELARIANRIDEERRTRHAQTDEVESIRAPAGTWRRMPVLMVGAKLAADRACIESLRLRGYEVHVAHSEQEGITLYDRVSPELVLCDAQLGRNEGSDFILSLRGVYGVEEIPVVLVDSARHEGRREVAQRVGAAGYIVHPVDVRRIEQRIEQLVREPRRRRFTRYDSRLPIQIGRTSEASLATALGRGGLFLSTPEPMPVESLHVCRMTLPELGRAIAFEAEVLYQLPSSGTASPGVGVRFQSFESGHEPVLLQYLRNIDPSAHAYA